MTSQTYTRTTTPRKENATNFTDEGKPCRKFRWVVEIEVDEFWVMDGLDLSGDRMDEVMLNHFGFAKSDEIKCRVLRQPNPKLIREAQGYTPESV